MKKKLLLAIFCSFVVFTAQAKDDLNFAGFDQEINMNPRVQQFSLENLSGLNNLDISFCDSRVTQWCACPDQRTGLAGKKVNEYVTISPYLKGEWRFGSDYNLSFIPHENFISNQLYKITLDTSLFPKFIKIDNSLSVKTLPLLPTIVEMSYMQDGKELSKKFIQTKIEFNYPIVLKSLEDRVSFVRASTKGKLPFTLSCDETHTKCVAITSIESLGKSEDFVTVSIKDGVNPLYGGEVFYNKNIKNFNKSSSRYSYEQRVLLPSLSSYLRINKVESRIIRDQNFIPYQVILVTTNIPVLSTEIRDHLELFLLPKDKPAVRGMVGKEDYEWKSPIEVTDDILQSSSKVNFELLPSALENTTLHSFKVNTIANRYLFVKVKQGVRAEGDFTLGSNYTSVVEAPVANKEVRIMSNGSILSLVGEKKLSFYSSGVSKLQVEIDKISWADINHLISQTKRYNAFQKPTFINEYSFNEYNISEVFKEDIIVNVENLDKNTANYSTLDFNKYFDKKDNNKGLFLTKIFSKNEKGEIIAEDKRLILITDFGFIVKTDNDGLHHVFVSYISTGKPAVGITVDIIGLNGEVLQTGTTNSDGCAIVPSVRTGIREKTPVAYVVRNDNDVSFMPYDRIDRRVNYSRSNVLGSFSSHEGLKAYLFSDRDVYRPGEKGHIGILVKQSDGQNLSGLPLDITLTNPRGKLINKDKITLNEEGFVEYLFQTNPTSLTGLYTVSLDIAQGQKNSSHLGNLHLQVEDFMPDRMKININFDKDQNKLWLSPEGLNARVKLVNLYGIPAANRKITSRASITAAHFSIDAFKDYKFYSAQKDNQFFEESLGDTITDNEGKAIIDLKLKKYANASYNLRLMVEGFEPDSGKSVYADESIIVSPLPYIIGFKADSDLRYIKQNSQARVEFIAVDSDGKKINIPAFRLNLKKNHYVNGVVMGSDGSYSYQSVPVEKSIFSSTVNIGAKASYNYDIPTKEPGEYILYLTGEKDEIVYSQVNFTVLGEGNISGNLTNSASLTVKLNKDSYKPGEKILLDVIAPYQGYGLITIETDKVHNYQWFRTKKTDSIQEIKIPDNFEGKGFVNVQFMKDPFSKEIFITPFIYAVVPFLADITNHEQKIELEVPKKIKSGEKVTIGYRTDHPGKIIIFAVDQGILSFAHYKTPDPLDYFIKDRALEVQTSQIMDLILPENSLMMKVFASSAGDGDVEINKVLNPFKRVDQAPVALWSGIIDATSKQEKITFDIPNYFNGTLKVMAVAASSTAVGANTTDVMVQSDFIITPNLPLFMVPFDEFTTPVTIANNVPKSGSARVRINVESSNGLEILDYPKEIVIEENRENTIKIRLKATDKIGNATLKVAASLGDIKSEITTTTSVRPAAARVTTVETGFVPGNKEKLKISRSLYPEFAKLQISASSSPLSMISGFKNYLDEYPFSCTEQLVSKNFVNVMLSEEAKSAHLIQTKPDKIDDSLFGIFQILIERQNADGGFKVWSWENADSNSFISVYTMHFLTECANRNYPVPVNLFNSGLDYLKNFANRSITSLNDAREKAYAIYVLTKNNEITTNYIANILNYLNANAQEAWNDDLVALYLASSYQMLQMHVEAEKLLNNFDLSKAVPKSEYSYYNPLIKYSQYVYLMSCHFSEKLKMIDKAVIGAIANFAKNNYNTLSVNYAIMASVAYADKIEDVLKSSINAKFYDKNQKMHEIELTGNNPKGVDLSSIIATTSEPVLKINELRELSLSSNTNGFFYQLSISGFDKFYQGDKEIVKGVVINKKYLDENNKEVNKVKLGDNITVELTIQSYSVQPLENMVVLDLLPGGFELLRDNNLNVLRNNESKEDNKNVAMWRPVYVDNREDRVVMFGTIRANKVRYRYRIKAINNGIFTTPAVYCESMYNPQIYYRGIIGNIAVR